MGKKGTGNRGYGTGDKGQGTGDGKEQNMEQEVWAETWTDLSLYSRDTLGACHQCVKLST